MPHLCIKYRNQKKHKASTILEQTFIDIPAGTAEERSVYAEIVDEYIRDHDWLQLVSYIHHTQTSRLMHSMHVSYLCFLHAFRKGWDYVSAAIGGLLHDFCLSNKGEYPRRKFLDIWCFWHAKQALTMSESKYELNHITKNMIRSHMFPSTITFPKYKESWLIVYWDKYCAVREYLHKTKIPAIV